MVRNLVAGFPGHVCAGRAFAAVGRVGSYNAAITAAKNVRLRHAF